MRWSWVPRGIVVSQEVQIGWSYTYVVAAIESMAGRLW